MAEQTRETLRQYFRAGQLPTEAHFDDLVDSMLNMKDEGFSKTPLDGLQVSAAGDGALASLYRDRDPTQARWQMRFGDQRERLQFDRGSADQPDAVPGVLCLDAVHQPAADGRPARTEPRVGIGVSAPAHTLDVAGVVAARGRIGSLAVGDPGGVRADGRPKTLLKNLTGCQAFEVMAGVGGGRGSGRFALLHAVVLNAYHPHRSWWQRWWPGRSGVRVTSAHYGRRCDRLRLAWEGERHGRDADYRLTISTGCDYGPGVMIRVSVTQLWFDPTMDGSLPTPP
jgi:hypothetical protein